MILSRTRALPTEVPGFKVHSRGRDTLIRQLDIG
jgi:hypothetical protein